MTETQLSMTRGARTTGIALLLVLAAAGLSALLVFWREVLPSEDMASLSLPVVAFVAGVASTFNPCSLPALPGFLAAAGAAGAEVSSGQRVRRSLAASFGAAAVIVVLGVVVALAGSGTKDLLEPNFRWVQLVIGIALVVAAALHLAGLTSRLPLVRSLTELGGQAWERGIGRPTTGSSVAWGAGFVAVGAG